MPRPKSHNTKEAAAYMGVSIGVLNKLALEGVVVRYKVGGRWRYDEPDLDEYCRQQRRTGEETASQIRAYEPRPARLRPNGRKRMSTEEAIRRIKEISRRS